MKVQPLTADEFAAIREGRLMLSYADDRGRNGAHGHPHRCHESEGWCHPSCSYCRHVPEWSTHVETALHLLARSDADLSAPHAVHGEDGNEHVWLPMWRVVDVGGIRGGGVDYDQRQCPCGMMEWQWQWQDNIERVQLAALQSMGVPEHLLRNPHEATALAEHRARRQHLREYRRSLADALNERDD